MPTLSCNVQEERKMEMNMKSCGDEKGETVQGKRPVQKASSQLIPIKDSSEGDQKIIHSPLISGG